MLGAIIGDVVGSRFEFHNIKTKDFELFHEDCRFTDDTAMTCAIDLALWSGADPVLCMKKVGKAYPSAGYGGTFISWVLSDDPQPYYSYGNGAAMRVSGVGWLANSEEEVKKLSYEMTSVTHDHPEGLKGAETTAMMVYKARKGATKGELRAYAESMYPEIADLDYETLRKTYFHGEESCQLTVPQAIYCFLVSDSFEDCLRTTISIGGDCDTTAAISCAIAEAFYGIPEWMKKAVLAYFGDEDRRLLLTGVNKLAEKCGINDYLPL